MPLDKSRVSDVQEISGHGVTAKVDGHDVAAGNHRLMEQLGIEFTECSHVGTVVHVAIDGKYCGHILICDVVKPDAKDAISALKRVGVKETVMLTGDSDKVAQSVAKELGIDSVFSQLLPEDKVRKVEELLAKKAARRNAGLRGRWHKRRPVLSRADVGIAMGALGSDAAIEASDVVLMDDSPQDCKGDTHIAQVPAHSLRKHLLCHRREAGVSGAGRGGHCEHVGGNIRRRRRDGDSRSQRHKGAEREKALTGGSHGERQEIECCDSSEIHEDLLGIVRSCPPSSFTTWLSCSRFLATPRAYASYSFSSRRRCACATLQRR